MVDFLVDFIRLNPKLVLAAVGIVGCEDVSKNKP